MAPDFKTYLATSVISDGNIVTYRTLSRALKVHVNAAKCMLYEFHKNENAKSPGSICATYLLSGQKKQRFLTVVPFKPQVNINASASFTNGNGDVPMPSSPPIGPVSSFAAASQDTERLEEHPNVPIKSITLCREENLEAVKEQYNQITAIHIYSLSPTRLADLQSLTDTSRAVFNDYHAKQDPLIHNKDYGIIQNAYVRRRKGKRPTNINLPQPASGKEESSTTTAKQQSTTASAGISKQNNAKKEDAPSPASIDNTRTSATKASLKRDGSSLFKAFAKQSGHPKLERNDTSTSADSRAPGELDANADEGESEDEALFLDTNTKKNAKKRPSDTQREREERQAKLRKMMDDDDSSETAAAVPKVSNATDMDADPPAARADEDANAPEGDINWSDSDAERQTAKKHKAEKEEPPKRRRGRRKVMKKKTMKDEEGFLVTKEEEAWESFSEDEPQPVKKAPFQSAPSSQAKTQTQSQSQKGAGTKAAGAGTGATATGKKKDIMSFFGRK